MAKATDTPKGMKEEPQAYVPQKSEKEKIAEVMEKKGFSVTMESGIPMFSIQTKADYEYIKAYINGRFSFGFRAKDNYIFQVETE